MLIPLKDLLTIYLIRDNQLNMVYAKVGIMVFSIFYYTELTFEARRFLCNKKIYICNSLSIQ